MCRLLAGILNPILKKRGKTVILIFRKNNKI